MAKKTVQDIDVKGKRVLLRVDYNVPLDENGNVSDDKRITASLPTVNYLLEQGARLVICSHLGRPKGQVKPEFSMKPVAARLSQLLGGVKVDFASDCIGPEAESKAAALNNGEILLLENLRFHKEEEANDPEFAKSLPSVAGFLIGKELSVMGEALENPQRPFVAILGGAKVADKIGVITNLLKKCDSLIIGGGMAYTFFKAMGYEIGDSLLDADSIELAAELMAEAKARNVKLLLPVDTVVADKFAEDAAYKTVDSDKIPAGWQGLDIGEKTQKLFREEILKAKTVIWNGPMGVFEFPNFARGTAAVAEACADCGGVTIIGGGDSASAVKKLGFAKRMTHISTGGGASLEFLEGKALPGVVALNDK